MYLSNRTTITPVSIVLHKVTVWSTFYLIFSSLCFRSAESSSAYDAGKQGVIIESSEQLPQAAADEGQNQPSQSQESDDANDSVSIENPDYLSFQVGPVKKKASSGKMESEPDSHEDSIVVDKNNESDLAIVTNVEKQGTSYQLAVPVPDPVNGRSESLHASLYGAIPVAAVHDAQASPSQRDNLPNHQLLPVLQKTRPSVKASKDS